GRRRDARRRPLRAARHDRGSDRALSNPIGPGRAHRARALPQRPRLDPSRPAAAQRRADGSVRRQMREGKMKRMILALALGAAPAMAQPPAAPAAPDYASESSWLCLPGRADVCALPLATADLNPDGFGPVGRSVPAADPPIDCFYVYPTVSRDPGMNSDLTPLEERPTAVAQFA